MVCILRAVIAALLLGLVASRDALADDDDEPVASALHAGNDIAWSQMTVRILDPDGKPIEGASVRPWALRAARGQGSWQEDAYGSPRRTTTADAGRTDVVFPEWVSWDPVRFVQVVGVSLMVSHPGFCTKNAHVAVPTGDAPRIPEITMERGVQLRIAGVAPGSDTPLSHCHLIFENDDNGEPDFVQQPDGWLKSNPVRDDQRWFRVVRTPPGEPPQFSKALAWTPDDPTSLERRVEVRAGVRVLGKVSDNVARPIERGHVVAFCGSRVHREEGDDRPQGQPIFWIETVPIAKDGSFEFAALPSGYLAQFYAFANESISAQPADEAYETCCNWFAVPNKNRNPQVVRQAVRHGQILRLTGGKSEFTLEMEPAGRVRVTCVDPDGRPLTGIDVSSFPIQFMVGDGSTIFCSRQSSLEQLRGIKRKDWRESNPYIATTNSEGTALIRNLPAGKQSFFAYNHRWTLAAEMQVKSVADETTDVTMTLQRRPSK